MTRRAIDWQPFDPDHSGRQIAELLSLLGSPSRSVLDLGCGSGRVLLPLVQHGHRVTGWDRDQAAVAAARSGLRRLGVDSAARRPSAQVERRDFNAAWTGVRRRFDAVICLGRTLMTTPTHAGLSMVFGRVARRLKPGGVFAVDAFPTEVWDEVASGRWRAGLSRDGGTQLVWQPGEAIVAIRRGSQVRPASWSPRTSDQRVRLWTGDDLAHHATSSGLTAGAGLALTTILVWRRSGKSEPE